MSSESNVADTAILEKANQLIRSGLAPDMPSALKILKDQTKRDKNQE